MGQVKKIAVIPPKCKKTDIQDDTADFLPQAFFSLLVVGRRYTGKTSLLTWCILHSEGWAKNYREILIMSNTCKTDKQWQTIAHLDNVFFCEDVSGPRLEAIIEKQKSLYTKSRKNRLLIILDDCSSTIKDKRTKLAAVLNKCWSTIRHAGVSIACCTQNLSDCTTTMRNNSTNIWCFHLTKREANMLMSENGVPWLDEKASLELLEQSTNRPFSFLNIDYQKMDPELIIGEGFREKSREWFFFLAFD